MLRENLAFDALQTDTLVRCLNEYRKVALMKMLFGAVRRRVENWMMCSFRGYLLVDRQNIVLILQYSKSERRKLLAYPLPRLSLGTGNWRCELQELGGERSL